MSLSSTQRPSPKDIVTSLMAYVGKETRNVLNKQTGRTVSKEYLKYKCPKPKCSTSMVSFLDKSGFNNPYTHLRRCYAKGKDLKDQEEVLLRLHEEAREAMTQNGGTIRSHFEMQCLSEYEKAIHGYIRLIVMKSLPLYYVSDSEIRNFSRYDINIGKRTLVEVIFKLVELVEKKIAIELERTKGAVLFDGWTCNSTHYIAVIASYCTTVLRHDRGSIYEESIPRLALLALSPMGHVPEEQDENTTGQDETTKFNAETRLQFLNEIFPFFGQEFSKWCLCLIGDNCNTNLKVASLANKFYVGCNSHKLNLEVNHMVDAHTQLKTTIESVHETMREAKKLKNAALLRNLTDLKPIMHNPTRWSGKLHMLRRFMQIRDELIEVHNSPDGDVTIDTSTRLASRTERFARMLAEIDVVTKSLQYRRHTLTECRDDLDVLIETVEEEKYQVGSVLYQCKLDTKYIAPDASVFTHRTFESGVVKIQKGLQAELTEEEKTSVACLLKENVESEIQPETQGFSSSTSISMAERLKKRRKKGDQDDNYIDCDFILGSVAEVERLWSIAKYVLTENRRFMTPQLFEAIVFLKVNERFWDCQLVSEAANGVRSERANAYIESHQAQQELNMD